MKFGICCTPQSALKHFPQGVDYAEFSAADIYHLDEKQFRELKAAVVSGTVGTYSANGLIMPSLRLTGPDVDMSAIREYCKITFSRLEELGIYMLVFGSGKAKHVPEGFPMEQAWEQLFELGTLLSDEARLHGQTVVAEPLSYNEVNIVNTVEEAAFYAKAVNRDNFKILVDFYHFDNNGEPLSSLFENRDLLVHTHFAAQKTRKTPETEADWLFFADCVRTLKSMGYKGAMTFEGLLAKGHVYTEIFSQMKEIEQSIFDIKTE